MEITALAQFWVARCLREGDLAIDATVGNGHDALYLARLVGGSGRVFGFDIQDVALEATRERLSEEGLLERVVLVHDSHAAMGLALSQAGEKRSPKAIMFNLGYLPGGDKSLTTRAEETIRALEAGVDLLAVGGVLTIVVYPGHSEGEKEARILSEWSEKLRPEFEVTLCRLVNRSPVAPFLIVVEK